MPSAADLIASSLPGLRNTFVNTFKTHNPLVEAILSKSQIRKERTDGRYVLFNLLTGGPGEATELYGGDEMLFTGKKSVVTQGSEFATRMAYSFAINNKMLDEIEEAKDLVVKTEKAIDLLQSYFKGGIDDVGEGFADQTLTGKKSAGTSVRNNTSKGYTVLNGDMSYYPEDGVTARSGVLQFLPRALQTATIHGVVSEAGAGGCVGWYNQYGEITGSGDRASVMRATRDAAERNSDDRVDLIISDPASRARFMDDMSEKIEYATITKKGDGIEDIAREGLVFGGKGCLWFDDTHVDIADTTAFTTAAARQGVAYLLTTAHWRVFTVGNNDMFSWRKPIDNPFQDGVMYRMIAHQNLYCQSRRTQGAVTGGAR